MKYLLAIPIALMVGSTGAAQGAIISPAGFDKIEANNACYYFGCYANARYQYAEGDLRGKNIQVTEIAHRLDYRNHTAYTATGRTWTDLILKLAETNYEQMSTTFSANLKTTPTEVFRSKVTWPTVMGTPIFKPTPWGGSSGEFACPLNTPWTYTGTQDLLMDYVFSGGTMANSANWSGSQNHLYYLDANYDTTNVSAPYAKFPPSTPACRDSGINTTAGAYTWIQADIYGITYSNTAWRDKLRFQMYSYYSAPNNAPLITAIGTAGHTTGINISARCNLLYLDVTKPWLPIFRTSQGQWGYSGKIDLFTDWTAGLGGLELWGQTAWDDSKTNLFSLTDAMRVVLPMDKPRPARKKHIYNYNPTATTGWGPTVGGYTFNPVVRISHK